MTILIANKFHQRLTLIYINVLFSASYFAENIIIATNLQQITFLPSIIHIFV